MADFRSLVNRVVRAHDELDALGHFHDSGYVMPTVIPAVATSADVVALEQRLGIRLCAGLEEYLRQINGHHQLHDLYGPLLDSKSVRWFREDNADWIDAYLRPGGEEQSSPDISVREHLTYGAGQESWRFRLAYLPELVQISEPYESAVYLLNPLVLDEDGEWEAWAFASWDPGATRYQSLARLIEAELEELLECIRRLKLPFDRSAAIGYVEVKVREMMLVESIDAYQACHQLIMRMESVRDDIWDAWLVREGTGPILNSVMIRITGQAP